MTDWLRDLWDFGDLEGTEHRLRARLDAETTDGARSEVLTQLARVEGLRSDGDPPVQKTPSPLRLTTGYCRNQSKGECSMSVKHVWVVLALVVAACGGGDDVGVQVDPPVAENAAGTQTTEGESTTQSTAAAAPTATTVAGAASSGGESIARVTIGDRQYEFALEGRFTQCRLFAGAALFGSGYTVDGDGTLQSTNDAGASVTFHLPVADWEAKGLDEP
ncbi:MAG: hypothetical protein OEO77_10275, partial [Acidimicrobiia bacterium]|nr:hypothetical protein [Acidimicrobiia bacterium]